MKVEDFKFYKVTPNGTGYVTLIVPKGKEANTCIAKFAKGMKVEEIEGTQEMLDNAEIIAPRPKFKEYNFDDIDYVINKKIK